MEHLLKKIMDATRALQLATHEIHKRDARIHDLEVENERLRARLAKNLEHIRRMEEGEL